MTTIIVVVVVGLLGEVLCGPLPSRNDLAGHEFLEVYLRNERPNSYYINENVINEVKTTEAPLETEVTEALTELTTIPDEASEVVKVSVTSSVVRQKGKDEARIASTVEEPTITAVQRSHFGVDESSGTISLKQEPQSTFTVERSQNGENTSFTVRQTHQGDSTSSFSIQRNVNLEKVEERTSFTVDSKKDPIKEEETIVEQRTFSTEARKGRGDPAKTIEPAKNWQYDYRTTQKSEEPDDRQTTKSWEPQRDPRGYRPNKNWEYQERVYGEPEKNYEVDEAVSVMSNGRVHGIQDTPPSKQQQVVEGSNFRKYRVEEKTPDGFIVGEYGVVSHDDGSLRGVRYTADSNINPKLIYEALVKFLSLK